MELLEVIGQGQPFQVFMLIFWLIILPGLALTGARFINQ